MVIFTERIETLKFLHKNLLKDLNLKEKQVAILHGGLADIDQQRIVEDFGKEEAPIRLLIASDVASEGINLHYLSHRLIHFDIPWSLMVFQQRNGRIDRYGQENTPYILYLVNQSGNTKIKGDMRILELLIQKDDEAVKNIGDPSALMGVYDIDEEEKITAKAIEKGQSETDFEEVLTSKAQEAFDPLKLLMGENLSPIQDSSKKTLSMPTLYENDYQYLKQAISYLKQAESFQTDFVDDEQEITLIANDDLKHRLKYILPKEVWPEDNTFVLSADPDAIQNEIKRSRKDEKAWPRKHYLWQHNPVLEWINDKVIAGFGRQEAPVLLLKDALAKNETIFILSGLIPNRKGHPLIHRWFGATFNKSTFQNIEDFEAILSRTGLAEKKFPSRDNTIDLDSLTDLLPEVVKQAKTFMSEKRKAFEDEINLKLQEHLDKLEMLKEKQYEQLNLFYMDKTNLSKKEQDKREIDQKFDEFIDWVEDTMTTEDNPFIQVIAVLQGE